MQQKQPDTPPNRTDDVFSLEIVEYIIYISE